jgi:tetratricopeptide (TPR) repeat protein
MHRGDVVADRFEIERPAGSGGMGDVYRALDKLDGQVIALKVLRGAKPVEAMRFTQEARVLSELRHPAVVRYVAHGVTPRGDMYLAMEWLDGEDLSERLRTAGLSVDETVALGKRVAEALGVAHGRGVVHRDVKPANLFLPGNEVDRVKILDFGIARVGARTATRTGMTLGTPGYMAPEQARGERDLDARTDVFALGCVLFECLTHRAAFVGDHVMAVLAKILLDEAPRVSELKRDVPRGLDDLIARMLSKDPALRPKDGAAVAAELGTILEENRGTLHPSRPSLPPSLTRGEQRVLSVVLLGSSSANADAATAVTMLPGLATSDLDELRAVVERHGGRLEALYGGTVVATLSGAGIATDQAAQAASCALAMHAMRPTAAQALCTGRGEVAGRLPFGEAIDRAARLLHARTRPKGGFRRVKLGTPAEPPPPLVPQDAPIALDEVTAGLLGSAFDVSADELGLVLRGKREVVEASRTLLGKPTVCVGRERELGMLDAIYAESVSEPVARVVLVTAPAGVGKTRVRDELLRRISGRGEPVEVWLARGDPMSAGSAFALLGQALKRVAGLQDGEPLESRRKKLRARVGRHVAAKDTGRVSEFLGELVGTPFPDEESVQLRAARRDALLMGDQMRRAFEDLLTAECAAQPVVLVLEDMQWGDLPTVRFVDAALRNLRDEPLFVAAFARPEIRDLFPELWAERGVQELRLGPLTRKASERLVRGVLGAEVPSEIVARVVERADGNAYYLEELVRAVAEGKDRELPETVLAMVQARLEALEPDERRVLRAASLFGQTCWTSGVATLLGGAEQATDLSDLLRGLVDREVLARSGEGRFPGEDELSFRHGLLREAAYASLTVADRTLGHHLAGQWLERVGEGDAMILGEHFERGGNPAKASLWYRQAAEQALGGNDFAAVIERADRAIRCEVREITRASAIGATTQPRHTEPVSGESETEPPPPPPGPSPRVAPLLALQAEAHRWRGELAEGLRKGSQAMELLEPGTTAWYGAAVEVVQAASRLGERSRVVDVARAFETAVTAPGAEQTRLVALARSAPVLISLGEYDLADVLLADLDQALAALPRPDPTLGAWVATARATRALVAQDHGTYLRLREVALDGFERAGNPRSACNQRVCVGYAHLVLGAYAEAEASLRDALAEAERLNLPGVIAAARQNLGLAIGLQGRVDEALLVERAALAAFQAQKYARMEGASRIYVAVMMLRGGKLDEAEHEARTAVEVLATSPPFRAFALGTLAATLLASGRVEQAHAAATEAHAVLTELGAIEEGEAAVRLVYARALEAKGLLPEARAAFAAAREHLLAQAARIRDDELRQSFLDRVPEHAETLALARERCDAPAVA